MRSRDGNSTLLLSICTLIFLFSQTLNAKEYLISYRYTVKDATLYNESLQISHAMKRCKGKPQKPLYIYDIKSKNLNLIIQNHFQEFIEFINKIGLYVKHKDLTVNSQNTSTTTLTLKTTCFQVDFNDKLVRIVPLK